MKKLFALVFLCCLAACSICSARFAPDLARWEWITTDAKTEDFFDKWEFQADRDKHSLVFNLMSITPEKNTHTIYKTLINFDQKTTTFLDGKVYDNTTKKVIQDLSKAEIIGKAVPYKAGDPAQKWADALIIYVQ